MVLTPIENASEAKSEEIPNRFSWVRADETELVGRTTKQDDCAEWHRPSVAPPGFADCEPDAKRILVGRHRLREVDAVEDVAPNPQ